MHSSCTLKNVIINQNTQLDFKERYIIRTLVIEQSDVKVLPKDLFSVLPNVSNIIVNDSGLKDLLGSFKNAGNLRVFESNRNVMPVLFPESFKGAEGLENLSLRNSSIRTISNIAFVGLVNVTELQLTANKIFEISSLVLKPLTSLRKLDMSMNQISYLNGDTFRYNLELTQINFSQNLINMVDPNIFCSTKKLRSFYIEENICEDESFYGSNVLQLQMSKCYDNFFESPKFLELKKTRLEHYKCFLDHFDEHAMRVYLHIYNEFHKNSEASLKHYEEVQGWLIFAVIGVACGMLIVTIFAVVFLKRRLNLKTSENKVNDMEALII